MGFKFCPMCGEKLTNESFKFCPECGYKFEAGEEPAENNLQESVNEQNIKNHQDENEGLDDGLAKDKRLKLRQLELMKKYGKLTPEKEQEIEQTQKRIKEIEEKNREENERKRLEEYYNTLYAEQSQEEEEELKKWIAENRKRVENREKYGNKELQKKKAEEEEEEPEELLQKLDYHIEKAIKEGKKIETVNKAENEENSKCYGAFHCHYSEKRYSTFIGVYPEFFSGVCTINKNRLVIQGKKRQKVIRFSNISSIEYNKRLIATSRMVITLNGGNIIELTISPEAYNVINQLWSQGDY